MKPRSQQKVDVERHGGSQNPETRTQPHPPRWARLLVERMTAVEDRPYVLSDLEEEFEKRSLENPATARRWYRAQAVRSALREDPDVILVGEMRDVPTMRAALMAAETGHLVYSTLHILIHSGMTFPHPVFGVLNYLTLKHHKHHLNKHGHNYASVTPLPDLLFGTSI